MSETEALRAALRDELACLWTDLQNARRDAYEDDWSMDCEWIAERIKTITRLVGPTPWTELDIGLIEDGVYQRIHAEIGVDAPYDEEGVRRHRARLDANARGEESTG